MPRSSRFEIRSGESHHLRSEQCTFQSKECDILALADYLRKIETDEGFHFARMRCETDRSDRNSGSIPCCILALRAPRYRGCRSLQELAEIAKENNCWYHVDAAYGGAMAFSKKHRNKLRGIELADSITFDPHKWMFVPFACGAVLVRGGGRVLRDAFDITPEYLNEDRGGADVEFDFFRYGQMGTRRFNSLKLWMAMKFLGREGYAKVIEHQIGLTEYLAGRIDELGDFKRVGSVETAVCCFSSCRRE